MTSFSADSAALIYCDVFAEELSVYSVAFRHKEVLEMGLHDHPDLLRQTIQKKLEKLEFLLSEQNGPLR